MARRSFDLTCLVDAAPEAVIDFLTDLTNHHRLHPYLVEAKVVEQRDSPQGFSRQWQVRERPRLGPIRYPIRFGAVLTRTAPTAFTSHVRAAPGCTIDTVTTATAGNRPGTALVHEAAVVRAPVGLIGYMARQAELAHRQTMQKLPAALAELGA